MQLGGNVIAVKLCQRPQNLQESRLRGLGADISNLHIPESLDLLYTCITSGVEGAIDICMSDVTTCMVKYRKGWIAAQAAMSTMVVEQPQIKDCAWTLSEN